MQPILCPFCNKELYRIGLIQTDPPVYGKNKTSPQMDQDSQGLFIICTHCLKKVALDQEAHQPGIGIRVSDIQRYALD